MVVRRFGLKHQQNPLNVNLNVSMSGTAWCCVNSPVVQITIQHLMMHGVQGKQIYNEDVVYWQAAIKAVVLKHLHLATYFVLTMKRFQLCCY